MNYHRPPACLSPPDDTPSITASKLATGDTGYTTPSLPPDSTPRVMGVLTKKRDSQGML